MHTHADLAIALKVSTPFLRPVQLQPIPKSASGMNLRAVLSRGEWDALRRPVMAAAGGRCEVCSRVGKSRPVECHEWWHFDEAGGVCRLLRLVTLCPRCHGMQHFGRNPTIGEMDDVNYLCDINDITLAVAIVQLREVVAPHIRRSALTWTLDTTAIGVQVSESGWEPC